MIDEEVGGLPHLARSDRWKTWIRELAKLLITAGLFLILIRTVDWQEVKATLARADAVLLVVAMLALCATTLLVAWRWRLCARASGIDLPIGFYFRATYAATFMGQVLPAGIGVDAIRLAYLVHGRARLAHALQSLVLDRLIGVAAVIFVMAAGMPLIWEHLPMILRALGLTLVTGLLVGLTLIWLLAKVPFIARFEGAGRRRKLIDLALAIRSSVLSSYSMRAFLVSVVTYCVSIMAIYWIAAALAVEVHYLELLAVVSMAIFLSLLPISLNGWGVREGAMVVGLSALSVTKESALAISLLFGFGSAIATLPGAFIWYMKRRHQPDSLKN